HVAGGIPPAAAARQRRPPPDADRPAHRPGGGGRLAALPAQGAGDRRADGLPAPPPARAGDAGALALPAGDRLAAAVRDGPTAAALGWPVRRGRAGDAGG